MLAATRTRKVPMASTYACDAFLDQDAGKTVGPWTLAHRHHRRPSNQSKHIREEVPRANRFQALDGAAVVTVVSTVVDHGPAPKRDNPTKELVTRATTSEPPSIERSTSTSMTEAVANSLRES